MLLQLPKLSGITLVVIVSTCANLLAQFNPSDAKVYKVDTLTKTIMEAVDFDKPLYISIDYKFEIEPVGVNYSTYRREKRILNTIPADRYVVAPNGKKFTLLILLENGLPPGKKIKANIERKQNSAESDDFIQRIKNAIDDNKTTEDISKSILDDIKKEITVYKQHDPSLDPQLILALNAAIEKARRYHTDNGELQKTREKLLLSSTVTKDDISSLSKALYDCESCKVDTLNTFVGFRVEKDLQKFNDMISKLQFLLNAKDLSRWIDLLRGKISLSKLSIEMMTVDSQSYAALQFPKTKLTDQLSNVKSTIGNLESILKLHKHLALTTTSYHAPSVEAAIKTLLEQLYAVRTLLQAESDNDDIIKKEFQNAKVTVGSDTFYALTYNAFINGNSYVFNFDTRNAFQLTPEFGLVYYGINNFDPKFSGVMPYLGFHVNFRYIHREIPFSIASYKWKWDARLSAFVGFTLASIKQDNERKDFFNNTSLLLGLGFRLGNAVRLVGGAMIFQHDDPNPVITEYTYAATPFAGISLDLSLYDLMRGINMITGALK